MIDELKESGIQWERTARMAQDKATWRNLVKDGAF